MAIAVNILGGLVQLTGNPVEIKCSGAAAPAGSSDYKILLRVISQDGKLEGAPFEDAKAPDENGERIFDISAYVDQPVKKSFDYPFTAAMVSYPTQTFSIQVQAGESYWDSNNEYQEVWGEVEADIVQMLKGGINPRQYSMMEADNLSFYNVYVEGDNFLTPRPNGELVYKTQMIKLWYMVAANTTGTFEIEAHFDDDSIETYSTPITLTTANLYEFNCNPALHGIDLEQADKRCVFFKVWLALASGNSQVRNFYFDWNYCERPTYILFANSLGGIDDVFFSGNVKDAFATEGDLAEFPFDTANTVFDPTIIPAAKTGQNKWTVNTGWKNLTTIQYYRDLMVTRQAWYLYGFVTKDSFLVIPVTIDNADKVIYDRQKDMYNIELTITEAHSSPFVFDNRMY
ncbi:hypothetical protein [uncultured Draconibacterium sp.]|uniref:hypothetical protein n=1 Tax=uncultured Draconibacterium sp. TaxID=1573823 RepID=UPI0025D9C895|nr:hypothetical protein [uncultured Draconibacterium sp.]